jgi:prepilin-type N-terminal cleavage/methylation domain-containing protein
MYYARYKRRACNGFTLVEILIVVVILIMLGALVYLVIDPVESAKRGRDVIRLSDIKLVSKSVHVAIDANGEPSAELLCLNTTIPCTGKSSDLNPAVFKSDGTGWVKTNISDVVGLKVSALPYDPLNVFPYEYTYNSTGIDFEVNVIFESREFQEKMRLDGGNNDLKYELGTKLDLMN